VKSVRNSRLHRLDDRWLAVCDSRTRTYSERVGKFVMCGSDIGTGGDRYLLADRAWESSRATADPFFPRRMKLHILNETSDLVGLVAKRPAEKVSRAPRSGRRWS
jgi:hypothetical protein